MSQLNEKSSKKIQYTYDFCGQQVEKDESNLVEIIDNSNEYIYLNKLTKEKFISLNRLIDNELEIKLNINNLSIVTCFKIVENPLGYQAKNKYIIKITNQKELTTNKNIINDIYFHNEVGYYIDNNKWYKSEIDVSKTRKYKHLVFNEQNFKEWQSFKKYLNIDEQIKLLKNRNLIIKDENKFKYYLKNFSYHNFVNGYNDLLFKNEDRKTNKYKKNASSDDLIEIFNLDRQFSNLILTNILEFERKVSSFLIDLICNRIKNKSIDVFGCVLNWNNSIISSIFEKYNWEELRKELLGNYKYKNGICSNIRCHDILPIWIIGIQWTFGNIKYIISKLNNESFNQFLLYLPKEFQKWEKNNINELFFNLNKIRNRCSHNNVIYNYQCKNFFPNNFILKKHQISTKEYNNEYSIFYKIDKIPKKIENNKNRKIKIYDIVILIDKLNGRNEKNYPLEKQINSKIEKIINSKKINKEILNLLINLINYQ